MNDTPTSPPAPVATNATTSDGTPLVKVQGTLLAQGTPAVRDLAIAAANNLPQLTANLEVAAPALAAKLNAEEVSIHASPLGGLACSALAMAVTHFGLNWSPDFIGLVVAGAAVAGSYAVPYLISLKQKV